MHITIAHISNRKDSKFNWFLDSLSLQVRPEDDISVLLINSNFPPPVPEHIPPFLVQFAEPKPTVWQGRNRLTKEDWFAASSTRNTALCLARGTYLVYVDDLSVLLPGWMDAVREAAEGGYVVCGAYKKVKQLSVENGHIMGFQQFHSGVDNRLRYVQHDKTQCKGNWLYGCSVGAPIEIWLSVNGWPEFCDGLGFEDCIMGLALENAGHRLIYDRRMMTYESEEAHHVEKPFRKEDWHFENGKAVVGGNGKDDKSHAALHMAQHCKWFDNYFGEGGIRKLREQMLAGGQFPIMGIPEHDWYSRIALKDL